MDNNIIIFKTEDEQIKVDVRFYDESVWLTIDQMAALFERDKSTISRHIKNVYSDRELLPEATVAKFATVQIEGDREVERNLDYYNLDVIISVGTAWGRGNFCAIFTAIIRRYTYEKDFVNHLISNAFSVLFNNYIGRNAAIL